MEVIRPATIRAMSKWRVHKAGGNLRGTFRSEEATGAGAEKAKEGTALKT